MKLIDSLKKILVKKGASLIQNINYDLSSKQKHVLICYKTLPLHINVITGEVYHPNVPRVIAIIKTFIDLNYAVDICDSNDLLSLEQIKGNHYDLLFGFGLVFKEMSRTVDTSILYVTENDPDIISEKLKERISYFKERHPDFNKIKEKNNIRIRFYDKEMFSQAKYGLIMTNEYNARTMFQYFKAYHMINVNGIYNNDFNYMKKINQQNRHNFIWFGSSGLYAKGLDILLDVFRLLPDYHLYVYGANEKEYKKISKLIPENVSFCNKIKIQSKEFIELVNNNTFIISASCMEGMQSGIATCMMHGLIPIITKECGYNPHPSIITLDDFSVDTITNKLNELEHLSVNDLENLRLQAYEYSHKTFTLNNFRNTLREFIQEIQ